MCTCINLKTKDQYFGRNLDLEYRFNEKVVITPRNYNVKNIDIKYAMIGMATVSADYPLYAEAADEKGLAMAGLYFPNNAYYNEPMKSKINLSNYGQGMGAIGLPGDNSPASRFIRVAFNKLNSVCNDDEESSVTQFFHILDSVATTKGSVITKENNYDITTYSSCINTTKGIYYYKTYNNNQITAIKLNNVNMNDVKLNIYELIEKQKIKYINYLE